MTRVVCGECLTCKRRVHWWTWSRVWCYLRRHVVVKTHTSYVDPDFLCQLGRCAHRPGECAWRPKDG